jgi:peptidyl-prolyl cis-trans isomerase C
VNGEPITQGEIDAEIVRNVFRGRPAPPSQLAMVRQQFGAQAEKLLVERKLLEAAVVAEGLTATPEELAERWKLIDARIPKNTSRMKILEDRGMTQEEADTEIALGIRLEKLLEKNAAVDDVTDEALEAHYKQNVQRFATPAQVRARHILLKFEATTTDEQKAEMKQKIAEIRAEVTKEGGKAFEALALEHSACPSGKQGGDLGLFGRGQMVPEFDKLAFELEPGVVSEPFLTNFGYHILEVTEKRAARTKPLEEVKEQLKLELSADSRREAQAAYIAKLRDQATIERPGKEKAAAEEPAKKKAAIEDSAKKATSEEPAKK